jgi:hypothetical protein
MEDKLDLIGYKLDLIMDCLQLIIAVHLKKIQFSYTYFHISKFFL